jgi:hypothetical protein
MQILIYLEIMKINSTKFNKIIEILNREMSYDEAAEYYTYNIEGSYMGEQTPIYMTLLKDIL